MYHCGIPFCNSLNSTFFFCSKLCLAKRMFPNPAKPVLGTPFTRPYGLLLLMLAALVAYGARSLTCGLAGCLALTASTFFYSVL